MSPLFSRKFENNQAVNPAENNPAPGPSLEYSSTRSATHPAFDGLPPRRLAPGITGSAAVHQAIEMTREVPENEGSRGLMALMYQVDMLEESERAETFNLLVDAVGQSPVDQRPCLLETLSFQIESVTEEAQPAAFARLIHEIGKLPHEVQADPLALASIFLPRFGRCEGFDQLLTAFERLPEEHRIGPLSTLCCQIVGLPEGDRPKALARVALATRDLPQLREEVLWAASLSTEDVWLSVLKILTPDPTL